MAAKLAGIILIWLLELVVTNIKFDKFSPFVNQPRFSYDNFRLKYNPRYSVLM